MNTSTFKNTNWIVAMVQFILGAALFVAPWLLGFAAETVAAWTAWLTGVAIALVGLINSADDIAWPAWANAALGVWATVAPWVVQFAAVEAAVWTHVLIGVAVIASSIWDLSGDQGWTPRVTA